MSHSAEVSQTSPESPFDTDRMDRLMEEAGLDVILASSKPNVQYLLGGHRAQFFDYADAVGISRYLPVFVYTKGAPEKSAYIGHRLETNELALQPLWVAHTETSSWGSADAMEKALAYLCSLGTARRIGVELSFLPADAHAVIRRTLPSADILDALLVLERLRARKSPHELVMMRKASELVVDSMLTVIGKHGAGTTKRELVEALRREETDRGLIFEYCLIAAGTSYNRAPSEQPWQTGDVLSIDSGGNYKGYIGDLARMAILGEPDAELMDLLDEIEAIQVAAMQAIRPGRKGAEIYAAAEQALKQSPSREQTVFLAHGVGLVTHEAPRLTSRGPFPYPADDAERELEEGMTISVETTMRHKRGFIKLEDTVAAIGDGFEVFGNSARGWNRGLDA